MTPYQCRKPHCGDETIIRVRLSHSLARCQHGRKQSRQNQRVGYFPTVGSATIRRNLLLRVVNNSDNVVNENGTDESPDTRLLHSLVRHRLALLSIYSAQRLRDHEQSTLCAVNSYWFGVNCWQGKQKYRCAGSVSYLLVSFVKGR